MPKSTCYCARGVVDDTVKIHHVGEPGVSCTSQSHEELKVANPKEVRYVSPGQRFIFIVSFYGDARARVCECVSVCVCDEQLIYIYIMSSCQKGRFVNVSYYC